MFMYFYALFTDPTILFTHLKIILLQCFQFSVFSFSNNKFNPNGSKMKKITRGGQKKNKENRGYDRTIITSGKECMQP